MRHFYIKKHLALLKSEGKKKHTTAFMSHKPRLRGIFQR